MTDINQLSSVDQISLGDLIPIFSNAGRTARKLPMTAVAAAIAELIGVSQDAQDARASADLAAAKALEATVQAGIATTKAGEAAASATAAAASAASSATAADVANARGKTYATPAAGVNPAGTPPGVGLNEFFTVPSPNVDGALDLYQNVAGSYVLQVNKTIPNVASVQKALNATDVLRRALTDAGVCIYVGAGPVIPTLIDKNNGVLTGFNTATNLPVGITDTSTIAPVVNKMLTDLGFAKYVGAGPVTPFILDSNDGVMQAYDTNANAWLGPFSGAALYPPLPLQDLPLKPTRAPVEVHFALGESTSVGAQGIPILSSTQPYSNTTFAGGPRGDGGSIGSLVPLIEMAGPSSTGETSCSFAGNRLTELAILRGLQPTQRIVFAMTAGKGSTRIDEIAKGTPWYNGQITNFITAAKALNPSCAIHCVELMTGINDAFQGTTYSSFRATVEQFQIDIEQLIQSITGQTDPVYFLLHQPSYYAAIYPSMAYALLDLAQKNPKFFLLDPSYNLPGQPDQTHFLNAGYAWMGVRGARAEDQIVMDGKRPNWINPVSATFDGTRVRFRCEVPTPPLVLDVTSLSPTTDMGFRLVDASGTVPISAITVENGTDVMLTPGRAMTGTRTLRYAADYIAPGIKILNGASGNLRDSTPGSKVIDGTSRPLYRLCPHFPPMTLVDVGA